MIKHFQRGAITRAGVDKQETDFYFYFLKDVLFSIAVMLVTESQGVGVKDNLHRASCC